jgi:hypothetical protein
MWASQLWCFPLLGASRAGRPIRGRDCPVLSGVVNDHGDRAPYGRPDTGEDHRGTLRDDEALARTGGAHAVRRDQAIRSFEDIPCLRAGMAVRWCACGRRDDTFQIVRGVRPTRCKGERHPRSAARYLRL